MSFVPMSFPSSRPQTPIRRISRGSIGASPGGTPAGSGTASLPPALAHLDQALGLLGDETTTLEANLNAWQGIGESLSVFGESFSAFLYGLRMNAFTVDWTERPSEDSAESVRLRKELAASIQDPASASKPQANANDFNAPAQQSSLNPADTTYATADESTLADTSFPLPPPPGQATLIPSGPGKAVAGGAGSARRIPAPSTGSASAGKPIKSSLKKPSAPAAAAAAATAAKPKMTVAEKKQREAFVSSTIDRLPLEWRGSDPALTNVAQTTLRALIDSGDAGSHLPELVSTTKLARVQVNKALNALVLAKQVVKEQDDRGAVYVLSTLP